LILGVIDHLQELEPAPGVVAADRVIDVPANDVVTLFVGVLLDGRLLLGNGGLLRVAIAGTPQVANRGNAHGHCATLSATLRKEKGAAGRRGLPTMAPSG